MQKNVIIRQKRPQTMKQNYMHISEIKHVLLCEMKKEGLFDVYISTIVNVWGNAAELANL